MIQRGVQNGTISSTVSDTAATWSFVPTNSSLKKTGIKSNKVFMVATGDVAPASEKAELPYNVRGEAKKVYLVPKM